MTWRVMMGVAVMMIVIPLRTITAGRFSQLVVAVGVAQTALVHCTFNDFPEL